MEMEVEHPAERRGLEAGFRCLWATMFRAAVAADSPVVPAAAIPEKITVEADQAPVDPVTRIVETAAAEVAIFQDWAEPVVPVSSSYDTLDPQKAPVERSLHPAVTRIIRSLRREHLQHNRHGTLR